MEGLNPADQLAFIVMQLVLMSAPGRVAAGAVEGGAVDVNDGPLLEAIVFGALRQAGVDVLAMVGADGVVADKLLRERIAEVGVEWETYPGYSEAEAARRAHAFAERASAADDQPGAG